MNSTIESLLVLSGSVFGALLLGAGLLHLVPRLGGPGKALATALCRAPGLDVLVTYFTVAPMVVGAVLMGWLGLLFAIMGQVLTVMVWTVLHEMANPEARKGPRIVKVLNRLVGRWRNHAAVWWTALAVPVFWVVRVAEWVVYPPLTWLIRLPRYEHADWVNVSRQKFKGLVGHDLIWCLYCDWMTGVWSLGSEMLRNVESFWCPIRFSSEKKCANCSVDFPDVLHAWASADGTMGDVAELLEEKYVQQSPGQDNSWFGHPARLTIEGKRPK